MPESLLKLPFDQYSRQKIVSDLIGSLRKKEESFTILDVGGYKGATMQFQTNDKVTILDVFDVEEENYVKGDARNLSFDDKSFDFVVSFDVLEHIPAPDRNKFLKECSRVASRGVFIAAPTKTSQNSLAENELNDFYKRLHGEDHPWLKEHIEYVLPSSAATMENLTNNKLQVFSVGSNTVSLWSLMQGSIFNATKYSSALEPLGKLNEYYNKSLPYDGDSNIENNYRQVVIGLRSQADFKTASDYSRRMHRVAEPKIIQKIIIKISEFYTAALAEQSNTIGDQANSLGKADRDIKNLLDEIKKRDEIIAALEKKQNESLSRKIKDRIKQSVKR